MADSSPRSSLKVESEGEGGGYDVWPQYHGIGISKRSVSYRGGFSNREIRVALNVKTAFLRCCPQSQERFMKVRECY